MPAKKEKFYLLYEDKDQSKLLATASSEKEIPEESEYYSNGYWFEYDLDKGKFLTNEKPYKKKVEFPEEPKIPKKYKPTESLSKWI